MNIGPLPGHGEIELGILDHSLNMNMGKKYE